MRLQEFSIHCRINARRLMMLVTMVLLTGCAGGEEGLSCQGNVATLEGQPLGSVEGTIVDRFSSFRAEFDDTLIESGALQSRDRQRYIPSAVSENGWLAQRLSDTKFSVVNARVNKMVTFSCPNRAI